ncbi:EVI2A protein, partial [Galbula dea]|nr:EVI2A protein [Galbula dea]
MRTERHSTAHFAFPLTIIFSLCLQTSAKHPDYPRVVSETWSPSSQNVSGSQNISEANTNSPLSIDFSSETTPSETQTSTLQPASSTMAQNSTSAPATAGPRDSSKPKSTTTTETCHDNKSLILICFVIIAVLVLICTFLCLSTAVIANRMSQLKQSQKGKRRPRSNGDILAPNSLWPTAAGTWQRMPKEPAGTDLIMEDLMSGRDAGTQRKTDSETMEKLTMETDNEPKPHKPILASYVVEI